MSGGRIYAPRPNAPTTAPAPSPLSRPRSQFAPERGRGVSHDRDPWGPSFRGPLQPGEDHSAEAPPNGIPRYSFSFANIPLHSREVTTALEKVASSRAAGTKLDAETERFLTARYGSVDEAVRAVSPPRAASSLPLQAKLEVGAVDRAEHPPAVAPSISLPGAALERPGTPPQHAAHWQRRPTTPPSARR
jgi:hypothetical protein